MGSAQELSRLLDTVLSLAPDMRAPWIDALGHEYADLKPRLHALVAREADVLMATLPKLAASITSFRIAHTESETVGAYRLVRQLGVGAMGVVWLAERTDGVAPARVALKFAHVAPLRSDLQARLAREDQLLRALAHPNIARLFDAGVTAAGQPYLVLEYVPGLALDEYVAAQQPSLKQKLQLFLQLTRAVAHAHQCQIVHRDLKPANVLVMEGGGVRLLDFGIGKLLADGVPPELQLSRMTGQPLTPAYASPEQLLGTSVGLPSDVYSLGVVLYELLTGQRPHAQGPSLALRAAITSQFPAAPSTLVAGLAAEVDAVVLKALQKQPEARYPSAAELALALEPLV